MLKRYMHGRERFFAMRDDDRVVHPFDWGVDFIDPGANGVDPREFFKNFSARTLANSEAFFFKADVTDYRLTGDDLTWASGIVTPSPENNTVRARYCRVEGARSAVVVLPHW